MTKQILLNLTGSQLVENEKDSTELVTVARYYKKNGKHYVLYEEMPEGEDSLIKNTLKFDQDSFEMMKKGAVNAQMLFDPEKNFTTYYSTPAGPMSMNIHTMEYRLLEEEHYIEVLIRYELEIHNTYVTENEIRIQIAPQ